MCSYLMVLHDTELNGVIAQKENVMENADRQSTGNTIIHNCFAKLLFKSSTFPRVRRWLEQSWLVFLILQPQGTNLKSKHGVHFS